jgi:hypothetical protein
VIEKSKDIVKTDTRFVGDIKHTTHYVNRPMRAGDQMGGAIGETINGVEKTTEIIRYIFNYNKQ